METDKETQKVEGKSPKVKEEKTLGTTAKTEVTENIKPATTDNDLNDEVVLNYFKSKGKEVNSIEELFKEPEKIIEKVEINAWEDVLDEEDKAYLNYKRETGRSRKDFDALNTKINEITPLEFARERVRQESGLNIPINEIDEHLERLLEIDDIQDLTSSDIIQLATYGKSIKEKRLSEQEKYRKPIQKENKNSFNQDDYITLPNGAIMKKQDYENILNSQKEQLKRATEAVNSVTETSFKTVIDDNGTQRELNYGYEYSDEDKNSVLSTVSDMDSYITKNYFSEKEGFNHKKFNEDVFWLDSNNRQKAISTIIQKSRAEAIEEILKNRGNASFTNQQKLPNNIKKENIKVVSIKELFNNR